MFYVCLLILCAGVIGLIFINPKVNMRLISLGIPPLTAFNAITASLILIVIAKIISEITDAQKNLIVRYLCRISVTSIVYLCINHICISVSTVIVKKGLSVIGLYNQCFVAILSLVIMLTISFAICEIIFRTKLRFFVGKK